MRNPSLREANGDEAIQNTGSTRCCAARDDVWERLRVNSMKILDLCKTLFCEGGRGDLYSLKANKDDLTYAKVSIQKADGLAGFIDDLTVGFKKPFSGFLPGVFALSESSAT